MTAPLTFTVLGRPAAQGSKRLVPTAAGPRMIEQTRRVRPWRAAAGAEALAAANAAGHPTNPYWSAPVALTLVCYFARPKAHYRAGGTLLRDMAPARPAGRVGDADKIARAACDALTGVLFHDDSQVTDLVVRKRYAGLGEPERVDVEVRALAATVGAGVEEALAA
jgi:crossover junction endodeoxyribonuclease RusA